MGSDTAAYSQLARCPSSPSTAITANTSLLKETNTKTDLKQSGTNVKAEAFDNKVET